MSKFLRVAGGFWMVLVALNFFVGCMSMVNNTDARVMSLSLGVDANEMAALALLMAFVFHGFLLLPGVGLYVVGKLMGKDEE